MTHYSPERGSRWKDFAMNWMWRLGLMAAGFAFGYLNPDSGLIWLMAAPVAAVALLLIVMDLIGEDSKRGVISWIVSWPFIPAAAVLAGWLWKTHPFAIDIGFRWL